MWFMEEGSTSDTYMGYNLLHRKQTKLVTVWYDVDLNATEYDII